MNPVFDIKTVEEMWQQALPVKTTCCREVRRTGDLFIKFDRRRLHGFSREMRAAEKLRRAGLPVVEHLFCGRSRRGNYLVTRNFADGVTVEEFLQKNTPDMDFFRQVANLARQMLKAGFLHNDFHLGNILYAPSSGTLMLTDVRRVKKYPLWLLRLFPEKIRFHVLTEFRGVLKKKELLALFRMAKINNPQDFYEKMFERDNHLIRKEWKRRREQILSGYRKFTRKEGDILFNTSATDAELAAAEEYPGGKAAFLAGFFLDLAHIPHRKTVRCDLDTDTAYAVPATKGKPGGELAIEMMYRLNFYDIASAPADWSTGRNGLPCFNALDKIAGESFILEE